MTVAAILPLTEFEYDARDIINDYSLPVYLAIGSIELSRKVQEADGREFVINRFGLDFTSLEEGENAMKYISEICREYKASYADLLEPMRELKNDARDKIMTYGFFSAVLTVMFLFIVTGIAREEDIALQPKYTVLHRAGMTWKRQKRQKSADAAVQSLWLLLSLLLFLIASAAASYSETLKLLEGDVPPFKEYLPTFLRGLLLTVRSCFVEWPLIPVAVAACLVLLMLILWLANRRYTVPKDDPDRSFE